ncbi:hypothetical protein LB565_24885 [Mesorhizobium sp. CA14]|uniref:hypothetical protein n=1 Tax=Mesorhizobium sp. CA14 TaxID=2876642 RepID=UPI001CCFB7EF|nr:hypothetical protein [Mesorhizobium sp. CA14]MBZ9851228.1 hypothetical protein [Mesorhizobium sp. CA14]
MSLIDTCEWSDDYKAVVATLGPLYRVIADRKGFGWSLQKRRARGGGHGRWFSVASIVRSREGLSKVARPLMHSGYVRDHCITQQTVDDALAHLPERFPEPIFDHQVVHTRPTPERRVLPPSYKTAHDIFDPRP